MSTKKNNAGYILSQQVWTGKGGDEAMQREEFSLRHAIVESASKVRAMIFAWITWLFVSLLSRSIRFRFVNRGIPEQLAAERINFIYAFYHGDLFLLPHSHRYSGVLIPVSESRDGEIMARVLRRFGLDVVRGSSKRKGHKALLALIAGMRNPAPWHPPAPAGGGKRFLATGTNKQS
jgi:hypothetical protein